VVALFNTGVYEAKPESQAPLYKSSLVWVPQGVSQLCSYAFGARCRSFKQVSCLRLLQYPVYILFTGPSNVVVHLLVVQFSPSNFIYWVGFIFGCRLDGIRSCYKTVREYAAKWVFCNCCATAGTISALFVKGVWHLF